MRISLGADEQNHVTDFLIRDLTERGHDLVLYGPIRPDAIKNDEKNLWPQVAQAVAMDVVNGRADEGIVCCWTGTGVSTASPSG